MMSVTVTSSSAYLVALTRIFNEITDRVEDEVDYGYKDYLDNYVHHTYDMYDNDIGGSDIEGDEIYTTGNDNDPDPLYKMFLDNMSVDGHSYVLLVFEDDQIHWLRYEGEEKNLCDGLKSHTQIKRPGSDISPMAKKKCREMQFDTANKGYWKFLNSTITDGEIFVLMSKIGIKKLYGNIDSMREEMENSVEFVRALECERNGEGLVYILNGGIIKVYKDDGGSSLDPELIALEHDRYDENSPFVLSKGFYELDSADEENPRDNRASSMTKCSQVRKGLMEILERAYDQKEYEFYQQEVSCHRQKERHREACDGRMKSIPINGVNESYLEIYIDASFVENKALQHLNQDEDLVIVLLKLPWMHTLSLKIASKLGPNFSSEVLLEVLDLGFHNEVKEVRTEAVSSMLVMVFWSGLNVLSSVFRRMEPFKQFELSKSGGGSSSVNVFFSHISICTKYI